MSDLTELLRASFEYQIHEIYTAIPCVIVNVADINQQRVDVQPVLKNIRPDGTDVNHPVILGVPLMFPATATSALTFEVNSGDYVMCIFSQRCSDSFKAGNGEIARPIDLRIFDKRDAYAILGASPFSKAVNNPKKRKWSHSTNDTVLAHNLNTSNEVEIRLHKNGGITINSNAAVTVNSKSTVVNSDTTTVNSDTTTVNGDAIINGNTTVNGTTILNGSVIVTGSITATGGITGAGTSLGTHTHKQTGHESGQETAPPT